MHRVVAVIYPTLIGFLLGLHRIGAETIDTAVGGDHFGHRTIPRSPQYERYN